MKRLGLGILVALVGLPALAATYNVNPVQSQTTIQGVINGASAGDAVSFAAGTYSVTAAGYTLKCGVTYTGPVATPATAILSNTGTITSQNFTLYTGSGYSVPCPSNTTTIQYFNFHAGGGVYITGPNSNVLIQHNQFTALPCCSTTSNVPGATGVFLDDANTSSRVISNIDIEWNSFGDSTSCRSPLNAMTLQGNGHSAPNVNQETIEGACDAIVTATSFNGLTIRNNIIGPVGEGVHILCYGNACQPNSSPTGPYTSNLDIEFNDFAGVHRINVEEQPEGVQNITVSNNTFHDATDPYYGNFGLSFACCDPTSGTLYQAPNVKNNVIIQNTTPGGPGARYGYGIEAWGFQGNYSNNLIQGLGPAAPAIAWCFGMLGGTISNNTLQGPNYNSGGDANGGDGYVGNEGINVGGICGLSPPWSPSTLTGNVKNNTISTFTSVAPTISPSPGGYSSPLTVTLTDPGYTSGSQPLGNTSIYYTIDGSTPNPSGASTAAQYYLSPSGSDSNPGTLAAPWLSPNHALNCGDTITAAAGTYSAANFQNGNWGTVSCSAGNNVAWLKCATFDACKISSTSTSGIHVDKSYWGVQGWEVTTSSNNNASCFQAEPSSAATIHHIIFANNVANGCMNGGFTAYDLSTSASVDYIVYVGNIAYNTAQTSAVCASGFNIYQPIASDTVAGTHMYVAGNFSYHNFDGCSSPTDGEGFIFDTWDFDQGGGPPYKQPGVIQNNIAVGNGGRGIQAEFDNAGSPANAPISVRFNTTYGNEQDANQSTLGFGECIIQSASLTSFTNNLCATSAANDPAGHPVYALSVISADSTDAMDNNWGSGQGGNNTFSFGSAGFAFGGGNVLGTSPGFANPIIPGPPSCSGTGNVPTCMATMIANFTPTVTAAKAYGYQTPSLTPVTDSLFPAWLCNVGLPPGLVSTPCVAGNTTKLYTVPIIVSLPATVRAVGMWGTGANTLSYPSGYGFVPSAVQSASYATTGGVTLASVSIAPTAGQSTLATGGTVQMIVTCHYSDGSTSGCNTVDSYGNSVTAWSSSASGTVSVNSSGLATGVAIGTATITATVTGGFTTSPGSTLTVSAPALTLTSVTLATAGGVSAITTGTTNQLLGTCHYSDGSATNCGAAMDSHGNVIGSWNSSIAANATVNGTGNVTGVAAGSTNLSASVTPAPGQLGSNLYTTAGHTANGYINYTYAVTGTATFTPTTCSIYMSGAQTVGAYWDCLLVLAPTPTTQASSPICTARYTITSSTGPGANVTFPITGCGTLPPNTAVWVGSTTNQPGTPAQGFNNCGGSCTGGVPTQGSGTYPYYFVPNTFGTYTGMTTQLIAGGATQTSQYVTVTAPQVTSANLPLSINGTLPTLVSAYLTASGSSLVVPNTLQMAAKCHYSSGADQDCTVADIYGDAVTSWASSDVTKATVNTSGLVTAVAAGTPGITAVINGGPSSTSYSITITNPSVPLTGVSLSTAGGVTGLFVGTTNQLKATCTYSDGSSDDCTATDAHGNTAGSYTSSSSSHATVGTSTGLVSGVAAGTTNLSASAGGVSSSNLPLTVLAVPTGIYTITIQGPVKFSGRVHF